MRLKKGDKVEVMNKNKVPVSWCVAEILYANAHVCRVQYDTFPDKSSEQIVETVSRKFVRPCQPLARGVTGYISGDIVEVFYEYTWMTATILKALERKRGIKSTQNAVVPKQFIVKLHGFSQEIIVHESDIRAKERWSDDKWILSSKSFHGGEDFTASKPLTSIFYQERNFQTLQINTMEKFQPRNYSMDILDEALFPESHNHSRSLKRMSPSFNEQHNGHIRKIRVIQKDGRKQRLAVGPILEKVDAVAYPREILGDKNMHTSIKLISTGYNQMPREKINVLGCPVINRSRLNRSDSDACSIGSCSVTDQRPNNLDISSMPLLYRETDTDCSDAESCNVSISERKCSSLPLEEDIEVSIHRLESHAYRRTLEALYASGPLSWEQEAMLTNLRIMLHISNDEHLMELKNLISAKTGLSVR